MRHAICLNLDYETHPHDQVRHLFRLVLKGMVEAGFRRDGRLFTINLPADEARRLARGVVEHAGVEAGIADITTYIKEFYAFDYDASANLLLPSAGGIGVEELTEYPVAPPAAGKPPKGG